MYILIFHLKILHCHIHRSEQEFREKRTLRSHKMIYTIVYRAPVQNKANDLQDCISLVIEEYRNSLVIKAQSESSKIILSHKKLMFTLYLQLTRILSLPCICLGEKNYSMK